LLKPSKFSNLSNFNKFFTPLNRESKNSFEFGKTHFWRYIVLNVECKGGESLRAKLFAFNFFTKSENYILLIQLYRMEGKCVF